MKKWSCLVFMVIAGIFLCGYSSQAKEVTISGIVYYINEETNTGSVSGYDEKTLPAKISIPETITENGVEYSIKSIGYYAFLEAENLTNVTLSNNIERIDDAGFKDCKNLKTISFSEGLENIGQMAFSGCSSLENIRIPSTTFLIDLSAFDYCSSLTEIKVDTENKTYYDSDGVLFWNDTWTPSEGINYTRKILHTYPCAKEGDTYTIEWNMTCAGGSNRFMNRNLKSIVVDSNNEWYSSYDGVLYSKDQMKLISCPSGKTGSVHILDGVETVGWEAFRGCSLSEIIIPDSVTEVYAYAFLDCTNLEKLSIGKGYEYYSGDSWRDMLFSTYKKLTSIEVSPENQTLSVIGGVLYNKEGTTLITCPKSVEKITISANVEEIKEDAFINATNLESISVASNNPYYKVVDGILYNKEGSCIVLCPKSVTRATVLQNTKWAKEYAFENCNKSLVLTVEEKSSLIDDLKSAGVKYIIKGKDEAGKEEPNIAKKGTTLVYGKAKYKVTNSAKTNPTVSYTKSTNSKASVITIPDTVKVNEVTYKVTDIASNAFANNKKVTKVTIGKNVTSIGKNAFKKCTKLKTVTVKSTVLKTIGSNAFYGDKDLKTITIKSSKLTSKSIGKNAFKGTNKKLKIKVPKKKVSSYKKFMKKKGNKYVTVKK